jgi:hypothetical protein
MERKYYEHLFTKVILQKVLVLKVLLQKVLPTQIENNSLNKSNKVSLPGAKFESEGVSFLVSWAAFQYYKSCCDWFHP